MIDLTNNTNSFGALLKKTREKKKIKIETISSELFIKERQLHALENEQFAELPQYTFTKGFALKYAEYLGLDTAEVSRQFEAVYPRSQRVHTTSDIHAPLRPMGTLTRDNRKKIDFNPWLLIAVFAVLALAITFIRVVNNAENEQNEPKPMQETINMIEQKQGASLEQNTTSSDGEMSSTGSAINLD